MEANVVGQDASNGLRETFSEVVDSFRASLQELRAVSLLRLEDSAISLFETDIRKLERKVRELEDKYTSISAHLAREKLAIKQIGSIAEACKDQVKHVQHISDHFPQHLPQPLLPKFDTAPLEQQIDQSTESNTHENKENETCNGQVQQAQKKRKPITAPRRYISATEYGSLSTYMTQRLPLSKVNTAVEEAANLAESNMKLLSLARNGSKMQIQEWKRAQSLLVNVANKEVVKGRCWFTDQDLKKCLVLKPDKTGKAVMTILRHLGRIHEARLSLNGKLESIYVMISKE